MEAQSTLAVETPIHCIESVTAINQAHDRLQGDDGLLSKTREISSLLTHYERFPALKRLLHLAATVFAFAVPLFVASFFMPVLATTLLSATKFQLINGILLCGVTTILSICCLRLLKYGVKSAEVATVSKKRLLLESIRLKAEQVNQEAEITKHIDSLKQYRDQLLLQNTANRAYLSSTEEQKELFALFQETSSVNQYISRGSDLLECIQPLIVS